MKVLLDTSTFIAFLRGHVGALLRLSQFLPMECAVSTIAVSELYVGAAKSQDPVRGRSKVEWLLSTLKVVDFDQKAAW